MAEQTPLQKLLAGMQGKRSQRQSRLDQIIDPLDSAAASDAAQGSMVSDGGSTTVAAQAPAINLAGMASGAGSPLSFAGGSGASSAPIQRTAGGYDCSSGVCRPAQSSATAAPTTAGTRMPMPQSLPDDATADDILKLGTRMMLDASTMAGQPAERGPMLLTGSQFLQLGTNQQVMEQNKALNDRAEQLTREVYEASEPARKAANQAARESTAIGRAENQGELLQGVFDGTTTPETAIEATIHYRLLSRGNVGEKGEALLSLPDESIAEIRRTVYSTRFAGQIFSAYTAPDGMLNPEDLDQVRDSVTQDFVRNYMTGKSPAIAMDGPELSNVFENDTSLWAPALVDRRRMGLQIQASNALGVGIDELDDSINADIDRQALSYANTMANFMKESVWSAVLAQRAAQGLDNTGLSTRAPYSPYTRQAQEQVGYPTSSEDF